MERDTSLVADLVVLGIRVQQVKGLETLGGDDRRQPAANRHPQPPAAEHLVTGFDEHPDEVLRQDAAEILPLIEERPRDTRLQVLPVMMVVIPHTGRLVIAADPDDGVLSGLPAELEALEVPLVIRQQVLAKEPERPFLHGKQGVDLHDLVDDLRNRRLAVEGADRLRTRHEQELVLPRIAACERRTQ